MWNAHGAGTNSARNSTTNAISSTRSTMCWLHRGGPGGGALPREAGWNVRRFIYVLPMVSITLPRGLSAPRRVSSARPPLRQRRTGG